MSGSIHESVNSASRVGHTDLGTENARTEAVGTPWLDRGREARTEAWPMVPGHNPDKPPVLMHTVGRDGSPKPVYMRPVPQDSGPHGPLVAGHNGREKPVVPVQGGLLTGTDQMIQPSRNLTGLSALVPGGNALRIPPGVGQFLAGAKPLTGTAEIVAPAPRRTPSAPEAATVHQPAGELEDAPGQLRPPPSTRPLFPVSGVA